MRPLPHGVRAQARKLRGPGRKYLVRIDWVRHGSIYYAQESVTSVTAHPWLLTVRSLRASAEVQDFDSAPVLGSARMVFTRDIAPHVTREPPEGRFVEISAYYTDPTERHVLFQGYVTQAVLRHGTTWEIVAVSRDERLLSDTLPPRTVSSSDFPRAPGEHLALARPLVFGEMDRWPAMLLDAPVQTSLTRDLYSSQAEVTVDDASEFLLAREYYSTLSADIDATTDTITVTDASDWPEASFFVKVNSSLPNSPERIYVMQRTGNTLQACLRGFHGTSAGAHVTGDRVTVYLPVKIEDEYVAATYAAQDPDTNEWRLPDVTRGIAGTQAHHVRGAAVTFWRPHWKYLINDTQSRRILASDLTFVDPETGGIVTAADFSLEVNAADTEFPEGDVTTTVTARSRLNVLPVRATAAEESGESWYEHSLGAVADNYDPLDSWTDTGNLVDGDPETQATYAANGLPTTETPQLDASDPARDPLGQWTDSDTGLPVQIACRDGNINTWSEWVYDGSGTTGKLAIRRAADVPEYLLGRVTSVKFTLAIQVVGETAPWRNTEVPLYVSYTQMPNYKMQIPLDPWEELRYIEYEVPFDDPVNPIYFIQQDDFKQWLYVWCDPPPNPAAMPQKVRVFDVVMQVTFDPVAKDPYLNMLHIYPSTPPDAATRAQVQRVWLRLHKYVHVSDTYVGFEDSTPALTPAWDFAPDSFVSVEVTSIADWTQEGPWHGSWYVYGGTPPGPRYLGQVDLYALLTDRLIDAPHKVVDGDPDSYATFTAQTGFTSTLTVTFADGLSGILPGAIRRVVLRMRHKGDALSTLRVRFNDGAGGGPYQWHDVTPNTDDDPVTTEIDLYSDKGSWSVSDFTGATVELELSGTDGQTYEIYGLNQIDVYYWNENAEPTSQILACSLQGAADDLAGTYTGTPGGLIENPADVVLWLLQSVLGIDSSLLDTASFVTARAARQDWKVAGALAQEQEASLVLSRLCAQTLMRLLWTGDRFRLKTWPESDAEPDMVLTASEVVRVESLAHQNLAALINAPRIQYAPDYVTGAVTEFTPFKPQDVTLRVQDYLWRDRVRGVLPGVVKRWGEAMYYADFSAAQESYELYQRWFPRIISAEYIRDVTTAQKLMEAILDFWARLHWRIVLVADEYALGLEPWDVVAVGHPDLVEAVGTSEAAPRWGQHDERALKWGGLGYPEMRFVTESAELLEAGVRIRGLSLTGVCV